MFNLYALMPLISFLMTVYAPLTGDTKLNWLVPLAAVSLVLIIVLVIVGRKRK